MPRRTHIRVEEGEAAERILRHYIDLALSNEQHDYLTFEAARMMERLRQQGNPRKTTIQDVIRAMINAHRKRNLLLHRQLDPDDI